MKQCRHCNTINKDDYIYCMKCGRRLDGEDRKFDLKGILQNRKLLAAAAACLVLAAALAIFLSGRGDKVDAGWVQMVEKDGFCHLYRNGSEVASFDYEETERMSRNFDNSTAAVLYLQDGRRHLSVLRGNKLGTIDEDIYDFSISDDGKRIMYLVYGEPSIYEYDVKSGKKTVAAGNEGAEGYPARAYSYSGKNIA